MVCATRTWRLSEGLSWTPVEVLGTVPVEADGSAHFRVPVDTPVYFQLLDENYMELRRMRSFISFQPGEQRGCVGCHESKAVAPHAAVGTVGLRARAVGPRAAALGRAAAQLPPRHPTGVRSPLRHVPRRTEACRQIWISRAA